MDETERVLVRLRRIETLRAAAPPRALLAELKALVPEAEAWALVEGDARARAAAVKLREEAEGMR
jgi:uncharacterized iron-regulated membrane protein